MNREILFRGKRIDNGKWIEGFYTKLYGNGECAPCYMIFAINEEEKSSQPYSVDPETVCQYTGLTDKTGKRIFEGDIVKLPKCEDDIAVFVLNHCNYFLKGKRMNYVLENFGSDCFEVIGNIFDNPELIGE